MAILRQRTTADPSRLTSVMCSSARKLVLRRTLVATRNGSPPAADDGKRPSFVDHIPTEDFLHQKAKRRLETC
jgi:hypothetical protein